MVYSPADMLAIARADSDLNDTTLANLAGTSRAAIHDIARGTRTPSIDTMNRILAPLGHQLALTRKYPYPDMCADGDYTLPQGDPAKQIQFVFDELAMLTEADCLAEHRSLSWGNIVTAVDGITIPGDPLDTLRVFTIIKSIRRWANRAAEPTPIILHAVTDQGEAPQPDDRTPLHIALHWYRNAVQLGADVTLARHQMCAYLLQHGYPWLWPPHTKIDDYRAAIRAMMLHGGTELLFSLLAAPHHGEPA